MLSNVAAVDLLAMPSLANGDVRAHRVPCVVAGRRPIVPGTGHEGGIVEDTFIIERRGCYLEVPLRARGCAS